MHGGTTEATAFVLAPIQWRCLPKLFVTLATLVCPLRALVATFMVRHVCSGTEVLCEDSVGGICVNIDHTTAQQNSTAELAFATCIRSWIAAVC